MKNCCYVTICIINLGFKKKSYTNGDKVTHAICREQECGEDKRHAFEYICAAS